MFGYNWLPRGLQKTNGKWELKKPVKANHFLVSSGFSPLVETQDFTAPSCVCELNTTRRFATKRVRPSEKTAKNEISLIIALSLRNLSLSCHMANHRGCFWDRWPMAMTLSASRVKPRKTTRRLLWLSSIRALRGRRPCRDKKKNETRYRLHNGNNLSVSFAQPPICISTFPQYRLVFTSKAQFVIFIMDVQCKLKIMFSSFKSI